MALPVAPTPVLKGKEARRFLNEVRENVNKPVKLSPEPNFETIRKIALETWGKKHN